MVNIKLCGLSEPNHFAIAHELGVKYVGVVFFEDSPRYLNIEIARSILENILMDTMFDIPTNSDIDSVVINEDVVVSNAAPLLVHSSVSKQDSGA